ncbi:hypothetical protein C731_0013 [Mycolicibacterium hassiacum DSM 44199]|uniref:Uncharacterized protein n=1 Tax=Mycolicibacterium hassiacum (strain DSM 44199 / CIP 105218 / JCM 12690 / 3849) TaxID=1122247 RepID=K5BHS7_MYCHD|nr:hypothetical protein C731_0013 [Mycolicibacterium hassiacum DSM 44199]
MRIYHENHVLLSSFGGPPTPTHPTNSGDNSRRTDLCARRSRALVP